MRRAGKAGATGQIVQFFDGVEQMFRPYRFKDFSGSAPGSWAEAIERTATWSDEQKVIKQLAFDHLEWFDDIAVPAPYKG